MPVWKWLKIKMTGFVLTDIRKLKFDLIVLFGWSAEKSATENNSSIDGAYCLFHPVQTVTWSVLKKPKVNIQTNISHFQVNND